MKSRIDVYKLRIRAVIDKNKGSYRLTPKNINSEVYRPPKIKVVTDMG
jgi:hypothetical protein